MGNNLLFTLSITAFVIGCSLSASEWQLKGKDVTVLTGETARLQCEVTAPKNTTDKPTYVWKNGTEILFFASLIGQADKDRMSDSINGQDMSMTITDIRLDDERTYQCGLNSIKPPKYAEIYLTVNQLPQEFDVIDYEVSPVHGTVETVAQCVAKGAKPEPEIWFTDYTGMRIDVDEKVEVTGHENGLFDVSLTLTKRFTRDDHRAAFKCNIRQANGEVATLDTQALNIHYAATASLSSASDGELKVYEEGQSFTETCMVDGNPIPRVQWRFEPDNSSYTMAPGQLPESFDISADGKTITSTGLIVTTSDSTNNGTFTCYVSNDIGLPIQKSFRLGVYAAPVTTVPTTQGTTAAKEPLSAGSDAAVIGGVVAVAAFVIIVAIILIARYFMSHKGTYHTHEMKNHDMEKDDIGDDHPMVGEEDEELAELGHKKRTEYFM